MELAVDNLEHVVMRGIWSAEMRLIAFRDLCKTVQWLHEHGVAHRDLKPSNVLILPRRLIKLGDFGTARRLALPPRLPSYLGFPPGDVRYAAPELFAGLTDDDPELFKSGDIFALGATLFEIFTGTPLGVQIYDQTLINGLIGRMTVVPAASRRLVFDGAIGALADARPLPSVTDLGTDLPKSCRYTVDAIIHDMAALDYRRRPTDFRSIFRRLEVARIVMRNDRLQSHRRSQRRARRARRLLRRREAVQA